MSAIPLTRAPWKARLQHFQPPAHEDVAYSLDSLITTIKARTRTKAQQPRNAFDRIDDEICYLGLSLRGLQDEVAIRSAALKKERNALLPIHTLPVELFIDIFALALADSSIGNTQRLLDLSTVSVYWSDVIKQAPNLWAKAEYPQTKFNDIAMALKRSEACPITITYSQEKDHEPDAGTLPFVNQIRDHKERWQSLSWKGNGPRHIAPCLVQDFPPQLEDLVIASRNFSREMKGFKGGPKLRRLTLTNVALDCSNMLLSGLRSLLLGYLDPNSSYAVVNLLTVCDQLADLTFTFIVTGRTEAFSFSESKPTPVALPKLRSLALHACDASFAHHLLSSIRAEELEGFALMDPRVPHRAPMILALKRLAKKSPVHTVLRNTAPKEVIVEVAALGLVIQADYTQTGTQEHRGLRLQVHDRQEGGGGWIYDMVAVADFFPVDIVQVLRLDYDKKPESLRRLDQASVPTADFIDGMSALTRLDIGVGGYNEEHIRGIIQRLITQTCDEDGVPTWRCPKLKEVTIIDFKGMKRGGAEIVDLFMRTREDVEFSEAEEKDKLLWSDAL